MSTGLKGNPPGASRDQIVRQLRARGGVSAEELAAALGVSKQCVRKHLDVLERGGYVFHAPARSSERGRPSYVFSLTPKAEELFPRRYDLLTGAVLRQVGAVWGERGLSAVFCGCAGETMRALRPHLEGLSFDGRVRRLAELLDGMGYEAEAEKLRDGSYRLTQRNCPQAEVARDYRQLCDQELAAYEDLLGTKVLRESRIAAGAPDCSYRVLRPGKSR